MFDLESKIAEWRREMLSAGVKSPVPLEELESHLRDRIEQQMEAGRGGPEAFEAAVREIGAAQAVQKEFWKVEGPRRAREWKLISSLVLASSSLLSLLLAGATFFKLGGFAEMTSGGRMSSLAAAAVFCLLVWGGQLSGGKFPVINAKQSRDAILHACLLLVASWWTVLFRVIFQRYDFTLAQLMVAGLWGFITPMGVVLGMTLGLETTARKKAGSAG